MKTCNLSLATVVLGALAASYSACSAQGQDNTVPGGTTPRAGSGNASAGSGNASAGAPPVTGSAGSPVQPSAGAPASAAGAFNTGVGGAFTSAGAHGAGAPGSAGAVSGSAGAATVGGCAVAAGTIADLLIDDLDDGDDAIKPIGARVGYWYTYNDGTATQVPAPTGKFKGTSPGRGTSMFAAVTSGPAFTSWGAGMGFDFHNVAAKSCPYNASAYTGIKFWAMAAAPVALKAMIKIPATTPTTAASGTCVASTTVKCEDHFYLKPAPMLTATWKEYTLAFASAAQDGFGPAVPFDKANLIAMQFQVPTAVAFDVSIDDVTFY